MSNNFYARQRLDGDMHVCRFTTKKLRDAFVKSRLHRWSIPAHIALQWKGTIDEHGTEACPVEAHVVRAKSSAVFVSWSCPRCSALNRHSYVSRNPVGETVQRCCMGCHKRIVVTFK